MICAEAVDKAGPRGVPVEQFASDRCIGGAVDCNEVCEVGEVPLRVLDAATATLGEFRRDLAPLGSMTSVTSPRSPEPA